MIQPFSLLIGQLGNRLYNPVEVQRDSPVSNLHVGRHLNLVIVLAGNQLVNLLDNLQEFHHDSRLDNLPANRLGNHMEFQATNQL